MWETSTLRTLANEDLGTLAEYDPLTPTDTAQLYNTQPDLYAHTAHGSNRPSVYNRVFRKTSVVMTSYTVADTSLEHRVKKCMSSLTAKPRSVTCAL